MRRQVKEACSKEYGKSVRVNASGCLGYCEHGIAAVVYPAGEWLLDLEKTDGPKLVDLVRKHTLKSE